VHHGCGPNLWKHPGDRPPKVELGAPTLGVANMPSRHVVSPNCSGLLFKGSVAQARLEDRKNVAGWESYKTLVSLITYHSLGGEVKALNTSRNAALFFHAVNDWTTGSETGR